MLKNFISKERIQVVQQVESWQQAVELAAQPLIQDGSVTKEYLQSVLDNITNNGPYIILKEGFALPHAQSKDGNVKQTSMSLLVVHQGVGFSDSPEHNAKVLIFLASINAAAHMDAMVELVDKLEDDSWLEAMSQAEDTTAAYALL